MLVLHLHLVYSVKCFVCLFVCWFVCLLACLFLYEMSEQQPELSDVDKVRICFDGFENNN